MKTDLRNENNHENDDFLFFFLLYIFITNFVSYHPLSENNYQDASKPLR